MIQNKVWRKKGCIKTTVIVDRGMAEDVMDIARKAGVGAERSCMDAASAQSTLRSCSVLKSNLKGTGAIHTKQLN